VKQEHDVIASTNPAEMTVEEWAANQRRLYAGSPEAAAADLRRLGRPAAKIRRGVDGELVEVLTGRTGWTLKDIWGANLGWASAKRKREWVSILDRAGIPVEDATSGALIRCFAFVGDLLPHPYAPPSWVLAYLHRLNPSAHELGSQWTDTNASLLTTHVRQILDPLGVLSAAFHVRMAGQALDYVDVAVVFPEDRQDLLRLPSIWRSQAELADLVTQLFPDTCREHSPPWLKGQRLDIYVPSLRIAIEYHGVQHYQAVDHFGGQAALRLTEARDKRKAEACREQGVRLIEWPYTEQISLNALRAKLQMAGVLLSG
jgi:hypothetical protein